LTSIARERFRELPLPPISTCEHVPRFHSAGSKTTRSFNSLSGPIWRYLFHYNLLRSPGCKSALSRGYRAGVVRNRPLLSRYSEMVFKNPTLDARPSAHAGWHSRRRNLSNTWFATSNASLRSSQESIGSEIFSIIDCGTMKVRQKNLNTSAGTLCGQV